MLDSCKQRVPSLILFYHDRLHKDDENEEKCHQFKQNRPITEMPSQTKRNYTTVIETFQVEHIHLLFSYKISNLSPDIAQECGHINTVGIKCINDARTEKKNT